MFESGTGRPESGGRLSLESVVPCRPGRPGRRGSKEIYITIRELRHCPFFCHIFPDHQTNLGPPAGVIDKWSYPCVLGLYILY